MKYFIYIILAASLFSCGDSANPNTSNEEEITHLKHDAYKKVELDEHEDTAHTEHSHDEHEDDDHTDDGHDEHEDDNHAEHGHENGENVEEGKSNISAEISQQVDIETEKVSSEILKQRISTYGELITSPEQLSHVRARFPGLVSSVNVDIGDRVHEGTLLAKIESNDSLRTYAIKSPIAGTVIQRHANTGEFTSDQVLFSIANFDKLWAQLRIYPAQRTLVEPGQLIEIKANNTLVQGVIKHLIPVVDQPYQLARIELDNTSLHLSPGDFVEGYIVIAEFTATIAIKNDAIQTMEGKEGIFIKQGTSYRFSPIQKGRSDNRFTEVLQGVEVAEEYVVKNSYLIKADIGKSEAEHSH